MRKELQYVVADPTGNVTLLVKTPVPVEQQPSVAAKLMEQEPAAEQVGFLSEAPDCHLALRMAGGEFCGNASMSAAAYYAGEQDLSDGRVVLRVSGAKEPVPVDIRKSPDGTFQGTVQMPRPMSVETVSFSNGQTCPVVHFDGISHVVLTTDHTPDAVERKAAEELAPQWCRELQAEAIGLLFYEPQAGRLTPLVYVPAAGTLFWENSCGSGTTAIGAFVAEERGHPVSVSLEQPGGTLTLLTTTEGDMFLQGTVRFLPLIRK